MDEAPLADVDPVVAQAIEEDQVSRLEALARDRSPEPILLRGVVRQRDPDLSVNVANEARAVEA